MRSRHPPARADQTIRGLLQHKAADSPGTGTPRTERCRRSNVSHAAAEVAPSHAALFRAVQCGGRCEMCTRDVRGPRRFLQDRARMCRGRRPRRTGCERRAVPPGPLIAAHNHPALGPIPLATRASGTMRRRRPLGGRRPQASSDVASTQHADLTRPFRSDRANERTGVRPARGRDRDACRRAPRQRPPAPPPPHRSGLPRARHRPRPAFLPHCRRHARLQPHACPRRSPHRHQRLNRRQGRRTLPPRISHPPATGASLSKAPPRTPRLHAHPARHRRPPLGCGAHAR
jgi:hypothetical protein